MEKNSGSLCRPCRRGSLLQQGRECMVGGWVGYLTGKSADCQSLLSKQELGLRVINQANSDRNPGPYLYPKKCHWSLVPSSIKETDSCNKEGPYQISVREPEAAPGTDVEGLFYEG